MELTNKSPTRLKKSSCQLCNQDFQRKMVDFLGSSKYFRSLVLLECKSQKRVKMKLLKNIQSSYVHLLSSIENRQPVIAANQWNSSSNSLDLVFQVYLLSVADILKQSEIYCSKLRENSGLNSQFTSQQVVSLLQFYKRDESDRIMNISPRLIEKEAKNCVNQVKILKSHRSY